MATYRTTAPDGTKVKFEAPDDATPEELQAYVTSQYKPTAGEELGRGVALGASAVMRGAGALPALGVDAANALGGAAGPLGSTAPNPFTLPAQLAHTLGEKLFPGDKPKPMAASRALQAAGTQPRTSGEKWFNSGVEGVAGALVGPGSLTAPLRMAATGAGAGLGAEAGGRATNDAWWGRLLGGLAGGTGAGNWRQHGCPREPPTRPQWRPKQLKASPRSSSSARRNS